MAEFFVSCALGLEEELGREISEVLPYLIDLRGRPQTEAYPELHYKQGGIELELPELLGFQLNAWLKIANRVLWRISKFPAKSPMRLHERLKNTKWSNWIGEASFELQVDATECAVHNEKWIRKLASEIWTLTENSELRVFLRGFKDEWTLSLDTSGEHLHKRGDRPRAGVAPLRETLAAATLRKMCEGESLQKLSKVVLMDPMAGSGSFLREGQKLYRPNLQRSYAFEKFAKLPKIMKSESFWKNLPVEIRERSLFGRRIGGEIDPEVFPILKAEPGVEAHLGDSFVRTQRQDWGLKADEELWICLNPPYGERIRELDWMKSFPAWLKSIKPRKFALWLPEKLEASFIESLGFKPTTTWSLSNGGIPCRILFYSEMRWDA